MFLEVLQMNLLISLSVQSCRTKIKLSFRGTIALLWIRQDISAFTAGSFEKLLRSRPTTGLALKRKTTQPSQQKL